MATLQPLSLELLDTGEVEEELNAKIQLVGKTIRGYRDQHPKAAKAKGKVVLTIELKETSIQGNDIEVQTSITTTTPANPPRPSIATFGGEHGATLMCRNKGANADPVEQTQLEFEADAEGE